MSTPYFGRTKKASLTAKNIDTKALENSLKKPPKASFRYLCNPHRIKYLQNTKIKGAFLDFKRALVTLQLTPFWKPKGHLLEAKRASIKKHVVNLFYIIHKSYKHNYYSSYIIRCKLLSQIVAPYWILLYICNILINETYKEKKLMHSGLSLNTLIKINDYEIILRLYHIYVVTA